MKKATLLFLLIYSAFIYGQDCKYQTNGVDQFTKNKILETKYEWLGEQLGYNFKKIDNVKYLRLEISSLKVFSISDGAKLMFLTEKSEPITLIFTKSEVSRTNTSSVSDQYIIETILLSEEVLERFQNEKITKVRYYTTDGFVEKGIKEKRANKFREQLKCIE